VSLASEERWLKLFVEGEYLDPDNLPPWMNTPEMRRVMSTMQGFSEKERAYHAYQARQNYLRQQKTIQRHIDALTAETARARAEIERERAESERARAEVERERAESERARTEIERERGEKQAALAEIERLKARLKDASAD
jgi:chromosome segregation ATPase